MYAARSGGRRFCGPPPISRVRTGCERSGLAPYSPNGAEPYGGVVGVGVVGVQRPFGHTLAAGRVARVYDRRCWLRPHPDGKSPAGTVSIQRLHFNIDGPRAHTLNDVVGGGGARRHGSDGGGLVVVIRCVVAAAAERIAGCPVRHAVVLVHFGGVRRQPHCRRRPGTVAHAAAGSLAMEVAVDGAARAALAVKRGVAAPLPAAVRRQRVQWPARQQELRLPSDRPPCAEERQYKGSAASLGYRGTRDTEVVRVRRTWVRHARCGARRARPSDESAPARVSSFGRATWTSRVGHFRPAQALQEAMCTATGNEWRTPACTANRPRCSSTPSSTWDHLCHVKKGRKWNSATCCAGLDRFFPDLQLIYCSACFSCTLPCRILLPATTSFSSW